MPASTPPVPASELRLHGVYRRYVAQQRLARRRIELSDWQIADMARLARTTLLPPGRDVEVVRGPVVPAVVEADVMPELSPTVLRVLEFLPTEVETAEMARLQGVTVHQVKRSLRVLYATLGVESRHGAVAAAIRLGMLRPVGGVWRAVQPVDGLGGSGAGDATLEGAPGALAAVQGVGGAA